MNQLSVMAITWAAAAPGWTFDLLSALIGAALTTLIAVMMYRYRADIRDAWEAARTQFRQVLDQLTAGVELRYYEGLASYLATLDTLGEKLPLEPLYVAPRFVTPQPRPTLTGGVSLPDHLLLGSVWQGARYLFVAGRPGDGRTALLVHLARTFVEQNRQASYDPAERSIPLYASLTEISSSLAATGESGQSGKPADPAAPLIAVITAHASAMIAGNLGGILHQWLNDGQALVLLDGLDELSPPGRTHAMVWISQLIERYPKPRYIVTGPPGDYGLLADSAFAALPLAAWGLTELSEFTRRWSKVYPASDEDTQRMTTALKPRPGTSLRPFDACVAALVWQKHAALPPTPSAVYGQFIEDILQEIQGHGALSPMLNQAVLGRLATVLLKEKRILASRQELAEIVAGLLPSEIKASLSEDEEASGKSTATPGKTPKAAAEAIQALVKTGLLVARKDESYVFPHYRLQCYLAAWNMAQLKDMATLAEHLEEPAWADVFEFCAGMADISSLLDAYLHPQDDVLHTRLWTAVRWSAAAPPSAKWRGRVLSEAARVWVQPKQPSQMSEQAMLGLLATQEKGLPYLFKQVMANPNPQLRAQALQGLGLLGREADVPDLTKALRDPAPEVCAAAARALGAIACDAAIEPLIDTLLEAEENLRQVAAEALAGCGERGRAILKDAANDEDVLVRRSAVYGLGLIHEQWATDLLAELEGGDSQWAVRSAATDALNQSKAGLAIEFDLSPIKLEEQGWLVEWGATRGMSVGLGRSAKLVLMKAASEGEPKVKLAAIHTLAWTGDAEAFDALRQAMQDPDEAVCNAAWHALAEISTRLGKSVAAGN
ncbi:MAG: HEAT repeat domain-containing protein [Thermoflexales bacterium]|nr:HEAT repeat domain-containing protein [Thermoflexales bacterium]